MRLKLCLRAPSWDVDSGGVCDEAVGVEAVRRAPGGRYRAVMRVFAVVSLAGANAYAQMPTSSNRAMPGLVRMGVPVAADNPVVVGVGAGAAWLDPAQNPQAGMRALGNVAAAMNVAPHWQLGADVSAYRDNFGGEINGYGEPRLTARFVAPGTTHVWGAEVDARFVGGEAPSVEWSATSPSLRGLYGYRANERTWVVGTLGFHLNRSSEAVPDVDVIAGNDRRSLAASTWSGVPWGLGVGYRAWSGANVSGELSGEWLIGDESPAFLVSPLRVTTGVQQRISENFSGFLAVEVGLSRRRGLVADQIWVEEPRVAGLLGFTWLLSKAQQPAPAITRDSPPPPPPPPPPPVVKAAPEPEPVAAPPVAPPVSPVGGTIVDEGGRPMSDVEVVLHQEGQPPRSERTFPDGHFEFRDVPLGAVSLGVAEPGFDRVKVEFGPEQPRTSEIVLRPAVPAGQVRGKVLDLQGMPVVAQVKVNGDGGSRPGSEQVVVVAPDGSFELDLTPGRYLVRFEHADFAPQRRSIVVKDKGVVILNIALVR